MSLFDSPNERVIPVDQPSEVADPNEPGGKRRGRVIAGALGGLAVGLLLAAGAQQNAAGPETGSSTFPEVVTLPPTVPTSTATIPPARLDILVDGYSGTLFLAGAVDQQSKMWRWESRSGTPVQLDVPDLTASATFNSSRVRVAIPTFSTLESGSVLWVGVPGNVEPLAVGVHDYLWHETDPARIAWVTRVDGESAELHTTTLPFGGGSTVRIDGELSATVLEGDLVEFDDEGFIVQAMDGEDGFLLVAVDTDGVEAGRLPGRYLGTLPGGELLVSIDGTLHRASRTDLAEGEALPLVFEKRMTGMARSPVDDRWAIWELEEETAVGQPTRLYVLEDDEILVETTLPSALRAVGWSQDGRWIVVAVGDPSNLSGSTSGELWFIDSTDRSMHQVAAPGFISAIAAVP